MQNQDMNIEKSRKESRKFKLIGLLFKLLKYICLIGFILFLVNSAVVFCGNYTLQTNDYSSIMFKIYSYAGDYTNSKYAYKFDQQGLIVMSICFLPTLICFVLEKITIVKRRKYLAVVVKYEVEIAKEKQADRIVEMKNLYSI